MVEPIPPRRLRALVAVAAPAARILVAAVFVAAAIPKLLDPLAFSEAIGNYRVFPYWSWNALAALVPMLELVAAAMLLCRSTRRAGALILGSLTLAFVALIASVIVRGVDVECGCFGQSVAAESVGWPLLLRDLLLLAGIAVASLPSAALGTDDPADSW